MIDFIRSTDNALVKEFNKGFSKMLLQMGDMEAGKLIKAIIIARKQANGEKTLFSLDDLLGYINYSLQTSTAYEWWRSVCISDAEQLACFELLQQVRTKDMELKKMQRELKKCKNKT